MTYTLWRRDPLIALGTFGRVDAALDAAKVLVRRRGFTVEIWRPWQQAEGRATAIVRPPDPAWLSLGPRIWPRCPDCGDWTKWGDLCPDCTVEAATESQAEACRAVG